MRTMRRLGIVFVVGLVVAGCHASTGATPQLPCAGHACAISIQNDAAAFLSFRYIDSTGHTTVLGLVGPTAVRFFRVQWVRSATVRVVAEARGGGAFFSDLVLRATRPNELHFPEDFESVGDVLPAPPTNRH